MSKLVEIKLANVPAKDAAFLNSLIALFTDPAHRGDLQRLRDGNLAVQYNHENGAPHLFTVNTPMTPFDLQLN